MTAEPTLMNRTAPPIDLNAMDDALLAACIREVGRNLRRVERMRPEPYRPSHRRNSHRWLRRCQARTKSTGEQCKKWAMANRSTCRAHGGASYRAEALATLEKERLMTWVREAALLKSQYDALLRVWRWRRFCTAFAEGRDTEGILSGSEDASIAGDRPS
jgi:hypothetical protein